MKSITIEGKVRENLGKKASKEIRKQGEIPCNVYGAGENISFSAPSKSFRSLVYTPDFHTAEIKIGDKSFECIIKEIQFEPVTDAIIHIDFLQLVPSKKIVVEIPIRLTGTPVGIKTGGKLIQRLKKLKVKTTPEKLSKAIEVNCENLELTSIAINLNRF